MKFLKIVFSFFLALSFVLGLLSGCRNNPSAVEADGDTDVLLVEDPFQESSGVSDFLGSLSHRATDITALENGYVYEGGQFVLDYSVTGAGTAKNVGFLLFLNGAPQPYLLNGEGEEQYMHMLQLETDDQPYSFSFVFTPVLGQEGETLDLRVYSVYYPQFQPDMVSTSNYGMYHHTLGVTIPITFLASAPTNEKSGSREAALSHVSLSSRDMDEDFVTKHLSGSLVGNGQTVESMLESNAVAFIEYDGENVFNNLDVSEHDTVHITYQMVGAPGMAWRVSLYADHQAMTDGELNSWEVTLSKGKVATLEADIALSALDDFTTFYIFACPIPSNSYVGTQMEKKTASILLYKGVD